MFNYTQSVFAKTMDDLKKLAFSLAFFLQIFQIGYLIYALCIGSGVLVANIVLLALTIAYLGFLLYVHWNIISQNKKYWLRRIYQWGKLLIKLFTLGVSIYGLCVTAYETITTTSLISIILIIFMLLTWVLELLFSIIIAILEKRKNLFFDALKMDFEPVLKARNFFDKIRGREVEGEIVPQKSREVLVQLKNERKAAIKQKHDDYKARKAELKAELKAEKKAEKQEKKQTKKQAKQQEKNRPEQETDIPAKEK